MKTFMTLWVILTFVMFGVSVVMLSFVQLRAIARGVSESKFPSLKEVMWSGLNPVQRVLLWSGIIMFGILWGGGMLLVALGKLGLLPQSAPN